MYYTKGSIVGYSGDVVRTQVISFEFDSLLSDHQIEKFLEPLREHFNEMGEALHFKITLESEDI
jgi:hypothetical protein